MKSPKNRLFRCLGCGQLAGELLETSEVGPKGAVFHLKPKGWANVRPVECELYHRLSAPEYRAMHANEPPVTEPLKSWELA